MQQKQGETTVHCGCHESCVGRGRTGFACSSRTHLVAQAEGGGLEQGGAHEAVALEVHVAACTGRIGILVALRLPSPGPQPFVPHCATGHRALRGASPHPCRPLLGPLAPCMLMRVHCPSAPFPTWPHVESDVADLVLGLGRHGEGSGAVPREGDVCRHGCEVLRVGVLRKRGRARLRHAALAEEWMEPRGSCAALRDVLSFDPCAATAGAGAELTHLSVLQLLVGLAGVGDDGYGVRPVCKSTVWGSKTVASRSPRNRRAASHAARHPQMATAAPRVHRSAPAVDHPQLVGPGAEGQAARCVKLPAGGL